MTHTNNVKSLDLVLPCQDGSGNGSSQSDIQPAVIIIIQIIIIIIIELLHSEYTHDITAHQNTTKSTCIVQL